MKAILKTRVNNITYKGDEYNSTEELVSIKWTPEPDSQPSPFVSIVQPHHSDDFNPRDSTSQRKIPCDQPTDEEGVQ